MAKFNLEINDPILTEQITEEIKNVVKSKTRSFFQKELDDELERKIKLEHEKWQKSNTYYRQKDIEKVVEQEVRRQVSEDVKEVIKENRPSDELVRQELEIHLEDIKTVMREYIKNEIKRRNIDIQELIHEIIKEEVESLVPTCLLSTLLSMIEINSKKEPDNE